MKNLLFLILAIPIWLIADSVVKDTRPTTCQPSNTYWPFNYDTMFVNDTTYSVWYWVNHPDLQGVGTMTYVCDTIAAYHVAIKLYRVITNDTTWGANKWLLIDSLVGRKRTTEILQFYGSSWVKYALVGWNRTSINDRARVKAKFTIK